MQIYIPAPFSTPATEQGFINEFFQDVTDGYFVEIGAFDGVAYSNTRPLWELGWSGLMVEPDPKTFKRLLDNFSDKSRLEFLNAAVTDKNGPVTFYQHKDPYRVGWHSTDPTWVATWGARDVRRITVKGVRFADLPIKQEIDLLSIDAEGSDFAILKSMPEEIRPALIILEVDKAGIRQLVEPEMERRGYRFMWGTYLNSAYAA